MLAEQAIRKVDDKTFDIVRGKPRPSGRGMKAQTW